MLLEEDLTVLTCPKVGDFCCVVSLSLGGGGKRWPMTLAERRSTWPGERALEHSAPMFVSAIMC